MRSTWGSVRPIRHLLVAALVAIASNANGATLVFFDRATFNAAAPGLPIEDFEKAQVANGDIQGIESTLDSSTNDGIFQAGDILDGLRVFAAQGLDIQNNWFKAPTKSVDSDFEGDNLYAYFYNGNVTAVGFDLLGEFTENAAENVTVYDGRGNVLAQISVAPPGAGQFVGFLTDTPIDHILFEAGFETRGLDNVAFGAVSAPEPHTLATLLAGLLALLSFRWRDVNPVRLTSPIARTRRSRDGR